MKSIKDELQHIIFSNESIGEASNLKKTQNFLRGYAEASFNAKKQQLLKSEEALALVKFAKAESLIYNREILEEHFISEGAEQQVLKNANYHK